MVNKDDYVKMTILVTFILLFFYLPGVDEGLSSFGSNLNFYNRRKKFCFKKVCKRIEKKKQHRAQSFTHLSQEQCVHCTLCQLMFTVYALYYLYPLPFHQCK